MLKPDSMPIIGSSQFNRVLGWFALAGVVGALGGPPAVRAIDSEVASILDSGSGVTQAQADLRFAHRHITPGINQQLAADGFHLTGGPLPPPDADPSQLDGNVSGPDAGN